MLISRVLCGLFALALLDAAVASFADPALRWPAIAAAALYLGLVALAWRRLAPVAAASGALALTAMIAFGAIAPLPDAGLRLTAIGPGVLASLAVCCALLFCGTAIALSQAPRGVRIAAPVVAIAGAIPFAFAAYTGAFGSAFAGVPGWLAWGAVEILLPLASLGAVLVAVRAAMQRQWSRAATTAIAGLALLACAHTGARAAGDRGMPSLTAFEGQTPANIAASPAPAASGGLAAQGGLNALMRNAQMLALGGASAATEAFGGTPAPGGDLAARAVRLHEQAQSIPRAAFDVDALAATLPADPIAIFHFVRDHIATDVYPGALRGAKGALMSWSANPTDRALLLAALLQSKGVGIAFVHATLTDTEASQILALDGKPAPAASGPLSPVDATATQPSPGKMEAYVTSTLQAADRQANAIASALATNDVPLASTGTGLSNDDVRSHWWLRATVAGRSIDLDPSLPSFESGAHLGTADASQPVDALPASEYATVRFHLIVATAASGGTKERDVFDHTVRTADLAGKGVHLWMLPQNPNDDPRTAAVLVPSFAIGSSTDTGAPIEVKSADGSTLNELRFEISTIQPNRTPRTYRRWLLTPEQARDGAPAQHIAGNLALMVQTGPPNAAFVLSQMLETASMYDGFQAINAARGSPSTIPGEIPLPLRVLAYTMRDGYFAQRIAQSAGPVRFVVDRPQIAMQRLEYNATPGSDAVRSEFDIVENAMAAYGPGAPRANLVRGIVETEIERDIMSTTQGAYDLLASGATRLLRTAPSPGDPAQRGVAETVANGSVALALGGTVSYGGEQTLAWWDVDPASGNTVGRVTGGSGQAAPEYGKMVLTAANYASFILSFGNDLVNCKGAGSCMCAFFYDAFFFLAGFKMNGGATLVTLPVSLSLGAMC